MFSQAMVQFSARNWPMLPDALHRGVCLRGNEARSHLRLSVPSMFVKPWSNRTQFWLLRIRYNNWADGGSHVCLNCYRILSFGYMAQGINVIGPKLVPRSKNGMVRGRH